MNIDTITELAQANVTGWLGLLLYWLPLAVCLIGYVVRTWRNYQKDIESRASDSIYHPTDTIGTLIGRGVLTILPVGNLLAATFDVAPMLLGRFFSWIGRVFDQPLVPRIKKGSQQ